MAVNRKVSDSDIIRLNSVGFSLGRIGEMLNVHHTTITSRLKILNIKPADTRRAFMEDVYDNLSKQQREWLIDQLGPNHAVKDFVTSLIVNEYVRKNP